MACEYEYKQHMVAGIISTVFTFPADLVRRQLQVQGFNFQSKASAISADSVPLAQSKTGFFQIALNIYRSSGMRGFYRGFFPEILKVRNIHDFTCITTHHNLSYLQITPMVGITFSTFELCSQIMNTKSRL
jgi:hypothetical protein